MQYVNYNAHGQNIGHNSTVPHAINGDGTVVTFAGTMSKKTADLANRQNLISHTVVGQHNTLYCTSETAARQVAQLLALNPNYERSGA